MKHLKFALPLAFLVLMLAMGTPLAHGQIGGDGEYWSSTNCSGSNPSYLSDTWFNKIPVTEPNIQTFSDQLNVGVSVNSLGHWSQGFVWVQVMVNSPYPGYGEDWLPEMTVTTYGGSTVIVGIAPAFSWSFSAGDQLFLVLQHSGSTLEGYVYLEPAAGGTAYFTEMTYNLGYSPVMYSAYSGLYSPDANTGVSFTYAGNYLATGYIEADSSVGNVYSEGLGTCPNGNGVPYVVDNSITAYSSLSYTYVLTTDPSTLYYQLG